MTLKTKTNIFYSFIIISVVVSIFFTYRRAFITEDFEIIQEETEEVTVPNSVVEDIEGFEVIPVTTSTTISQ